MGPTSKTEPDVMIDWAAASAERADGVGGIRGGVSATLRHAREQNGLSVFDVADVLRIRPAQLRAIEAGRFDELPGMVYAVGFVRTYAEYLGLDAPVLVGRFRAEVGAADHQPDLVFPAPPPEGRVPGGAILLIAIVLAIFGYGGWYYLSATDRGPGDVAVMPERFAHLLGPVPGEAPVPPALPPGETRTAPTSSTVTPLHLRQPGAAPPSPEDRPPVIAYPPSGPMAAADSGAGRDGPPASQPAPPASDLPSFRASSASAAEGPPTPPAIGAAAAGVAEAGSGILIRAVADSWVQISDGRGGLVMTRLLRPGDSYQVPPTEGLEMLTGNAGGLEIVVNGRVIPPLGAPGAVVRDIALDADRLVAGTALRQHHN